MPKNLRFGNPFSLKIHEKFTKNLHFSLCTSQKQKFLHDCQWKNWEWLSEKEMSVLSEQNAELIDSLNQKVKFAETRAEEMTESAATAKALASSLQEQLDFAKKSADELAHELEQEKKSVQQESALAEKYAEVEKEKAVLAEREKSTAKV